MTVPLMRGAYDLRQHIAEFFQDTLPPAIQVARTEWNLPDWRLPEPVKYDSYDMLTADNYPTLGSNLNRSTNWRRRDITGAEQSYSARYSVIIFMWVCTPEDNDNGVRHGDDDYSEALRLRDDYLSLMNAAILDKPSLNSNGLIEVVEETINLDYLDAIKVSKEGPLWLAGGTITCDMKVSETTRHVPLGSFDTSVIEETTLQDT